MQRIQVWSLVRELRSCIPQDNWASVLQLEEAHLPQRRAQCSPPQKKKIKQVEMEAPECLALRHEWSWPAILKLFGAKTPLHTYKLLWTPKSFCHVDYSILEIKTEKL